eukprot:TRINITY_DN15996_c0_g1_i2.p1 TRINITY_DN15996_c0_g1~~TRINITY_DN15996_c0_g1_i2.p1  ORF type:complete len:236 (+),score=56.52 TRINITY_DN15996_c0_g1_i2:61-768(+)
MLHGGRAPLLRALRARFASTAAAAPAAPATEAAAGAAVPAVADASAEEGRKGKGKGKGKVKPEEEPIPYDPYLPDPFINPGMRNGLPVDRWDEEGMPADDLRTYPIYSPGRDAKQRRKDLLLYHMSFSAPISKSSSSEIQSGSVQLTDGERVNKVSRPKTHVAAFCLFIMLFGWIPLTGGAIVAMPFVVGAHEGHNASLPENAQLDHGGLAARKARRASYAAAQEACKDAEPLTS